MLHFIIFRWAWYYADYLMHTHGDDNFTPLSSIMIRGCVASRYDLVFTLTNGLFKAVVVTARDSHDGNLHVTQLESIAQLIRTRTRAVMTGVEITMGDQRNALKHRPGSFLLFPMVGEFA